MEVRPARLVSGLIGTGRVGVVMARALGDAGHTVGMAAHWAPGAGDADYFDEMLPDVPLESPEKVASCVDLLLIACPDEQVDSLVHRLSSARAFRAGQIVLHTGFSTGTSLLPQAAISGILPLRFCALAELLGTPADVSWFRGSPVLVAGPDELRPVGEALVIEMGAEPSWVSHAELGRVRAALAHVEAALDVALAGAREILDTTDIEETPQILAALVAGRAEALRHGAARDSNSTLLPGPEVTRANLAVLSDRLGPGYRAVHVAMMRSLLASAVFEGELHPARMEDLLDVLTGPEAGAELD